jgi:Ca-activated chloride channel family protein
MRSIRRLALVTALAFLASCASSRPEERAPSTATTGEAAPSTPPADATEPRADRAPEKPADNGFENGFEKLRVVGGEAPVPSIFQHYGTNPTVDTAEEPFSTFSIDVDTASYSIARAMLNAGQLPDPASVRVEEFVNSFKYDYPPPATSTGKSAAPFSIVSEAFPSPNRKGYHVLLLGLRGRVIEAAARPPANLVFVVDVSGSMSLGSRLENVKSALGVLTDQLREDDTVSIVVYGSDARIALPTASGAEKARIKSTLASLYPEGSTNAQAGILLGYQVAERARDARIEKLGPHMVTRLIVCSDGVANNGVTDADGIFATVSKHAQEGIELSTVGFGMGNYNDVLMERLAVKGQGRYAYVDSLAEAKKNFVENLGGELVNIARDVKIQVEFDKAGVEKYRLLGFENRKLAKRDFADDSVDAGEIGAGHEVTALYEVKLKPGADRIGWLRVRSKPAGLGAPDQSSLVENELSTRLVRNSAAKASPLSRLALVSSAFAEKLRGSYWVRALSYDDVKALWSSLPADLRARGDVKELGALIDKASALDRRGDQFEAEQPVATMDFDTLPVTRGGSR